ncbi:MAG: LysE family translocator [Nitratireductor sp.]
MSFIPELSVLIAYTLGVIVITLTPGPDMTFFISRAINQSVGAGLAAFSGALAGIFVHTALVAFGLAALIVASPQLFFALKIVGALYLAFLAVQALRNKSTFALNKEAVKQRSLMTNWMQGLAINLLNPKIILFFMTFLPQFISIDDPNATGQLFFLGSLFVLIAIPILVPLILVANKFSNWLLNNPKIMRAMDYAFASVFGAFAIKILLTQRS